jgi:Alginate export
MNLPQWLTRFDTERTNIGRTNIERTEIKRTGIKRKTPRSTALVLLALCVSPINAGAQEKHRLSEDLSAGLFVDAIAAGFYQDNPWFDEAVNNIGVDGDHWGEFTGEIGVTFDWQLSDGNVFGSLSSVYGKTWDDDASGLTFGEESDPDSVKTEQAFIGWRSQDGHFEVSAGQQDYLIGSGFLVADGANDGGGRGAFWIGTRKAFEDTVIAKFNRGGFKLEAFRLKNRARRDGFEGEAVGGNLEYDTGQFGNLGFTYIKVTDADDEVKHMDGLEVFDVRYDLEAPENGGLFFNAEYAYQENSHDADIESGGGFAQLGYAFNNPWAPQLSYRYTYLEGDDPDTEQDEGFRELAYGFTDWGTWYQGEIIGNFVFGNSNLNSHMARFKFSPHQDIDLNLLVYSFDINEEEAYGLTEDHVGEEIDLALDWQVNNNIFLSFVVGWLTPGDGGEQLTGGDEDWTHFMVNAAYSFH